MESQNSYGRWEVEAGESQETYGSASLGHVSAKQQRDCLQKRWEMRRIPSVTLWPPHACYTACAHLIHTDKCVHSQAQPCTQSTLLNHFVMLLQYSFEWGPDIYILARNFEWWVVRSCFKKNCFGHMWCSFHRLWSEKKKRCWWSSPIGPEPTWAQR